MLNPGEPAILAEEDASPLLVVDHAGVERAGFLCVTDEGRDLPRREATVGGREGIPGVLAHKYAAAVGGQQHMLRVGRIDVDVVHNDLGPGGAGPGLAGVFRAPETFGGPREDDVFVLRVLHEDKGAPRRVGDSLNLTELLTLVDAFVDTRAGAGEDDLRVVGIDNDRKDVGVVDDALLHGLPMLPPVDGLPGQVPGSRVDRLRIEGIDGKGLNLVDLGALRRADSLPVLPGIRCTKDAGERSGHHDIRRGGGACKGTNRLAGEVRGDGPGDAGVGAFIDSTIGVVEHPGSHRHVFWIGGIDEDRVEYKVVAFANSSQSLPLRACVSGFVDPAIGRAEIEVVVVGGIDRKGAGVAAIRSVRQPWGGISAGCKAYQEQHCGKEQPA